MDTRMYQKKFEEAMEEKRTTYYEDVKRDSNMEAIAYAMAWIAAELMQMRLRE